MEPVDCGEAPDVGGLMGPPAVGLVISCEICKSKGVDGGGGVMRSFLWEFDCLDFLGFFADVGRCEVVVETRLLLLYWFVLEWCFWAGETGDIGGEVLVSLFGQALNKFVGYWVWFCCG